MLDLEKESSGKCERFLFCVRRTVKVGERKNYKNFQQLSLERIEISLEIIYLKILKFKT